ncbi:UvrB/UvrC motif-containing protein [Chryseomicrobium aureum]|uniref:UvrB/UvrC motif-containing protein n=1 Tax=Chryseomicrobium aureum TaxID=1441723 RepID=UPI001956BEC0|nr:UvrB/UvrC motif-containing protein [Chryseomicrobium aureum]MBM7707487.1 protein arginine kinase activator [Chryseomicrobium aureum]
MICENCKQRPAHVKMTVTQNGEPFTRHLCDVCASQLHPFQNQQDPLTVHQLLTNLFTPEQTKTQASREKSQWSCPNCGWTYERFVHRGKFGCAECYETFGNALPPVMKRLHNGNAEHIGQVPEAYEETRDLKRRIEDIRSRMQQAIAEEEFETAATLRDQARELEAKLSKGGD